jgi:tetratricopeptide (TPR) repeat protein
MDSSPEVLTREEGLRLLKAGQIDEAIKVLEKVREKTDDAQACAFLGAAYSQKGDKARAIRAFEESLRLNETPKAYFNLAVAYESASRVDEAVREYRMAIELDPSYTPAQEAITRLHDQYAAAHPPPEPAVAAAGASQTQSFAGPPASGPGIGQAVADPFARQHAAPPSEADILQRQMAKEQAIADQHHSLMKNGVIYGAICGAIFFVILSFAMSMLVMALGGKGWIYMLIQGLIGAAYGSLVGLWIGYTCGSDSAGFQAGAVLGVLYGMFNGILAGSVGFTIVLAVIFGLISGLVGMIIGRLVEMSISD